MYAYQKFSSEQIAQIKDYFKSANYSYIYMSIGFGFVGAFARAYRWKFTLEHLGYKVPFQNQFLAVNIGYLMNMFIPRSGEVSRALVLTKYNNVPFDKGFGTIVAERVVDLILLGLCVGVVFFLQFDVVKTFVLDHIPKEKAIFVVIVLLILGFASFWAYNHSKLKFILIVKKKLSGLKDGVFSVVQMKNKLPFLMFTILIWASYIMMFYISIFAFEETATLGFEAVITTFVVGSIAIAFTNNGLGSYPFLVSEILLFYGIAATTGTAFGWIVWTSQALFTVVLGVISLLLLPLLNPKK